MKSNSKEFLKNELVGKGTIITFTLPKEKAKAFDIAI